MEERRKTGLLVSLEERQLVLYSEALKNYPDVKKTLDKYEKIYRSDFEDTSDFTPEMQTFFLYSFKHLVSESTKEWYSSYEADEMISDNRDDWMKCALCTTPNKYISFIINRLNNEKLNVGSDCIDKFPQLNEIRGLSIKKIKNDRQKAHKKIMRIGKFNTVFPGGAEMIKQWRNHYNELPIVMPEDLHEKAISLFEEADQLYIGYTECKLNDTALNDFGCVVEDYNTLLKSINYHVVANGEKRFVCTKSIKDWLVNTDKKGTLLKIIKDGGFIKPSTIVNIYEKDFFKSIFKEFTPKLSKSVFSVDNLKDSTIYFNLKLPNLPTLRFECSTKSFMAEFGHLVFNNNNFINDNTLIKIATPVWDEANATNLVKYLDTFLRNTPYRLFLHYRTEELEYQDIGKKLFSVGKAKLFCNAWKHLLLLDEETIQRELVLLMKRVNWKPVAEKDKYAIGDISKKPFTP